MTHRISRTGSSWLLVLAAAACHDSDTFHDYLHHTTLHEAYQASLEQAGLLATGMGRDWAAVGTAVLDSAIPIQLPYRESGYLPADSAVALAYRFEARGGEAYVVSLETSGRESFRVFVDLFRAPRDSLDAPRHVASVDSLFPDLTGEFHRDGAYLLRLQPELLRGGRYTLTIEVGPSLAFPVEGKDSRAILSAFGASRDGGLRQHHGVDIFAARGTPVLAAATGRITGVREAGLGGKVVWQLDRDRGQYLYYAHLDSQAVVRRQEVEPGDTIGFVGNTGNARTTPPHLHFGIYRRGRGPLDPWPFIHSPTTRLEPVQADTSLLGRWVRVHQAVAVQHQAKAQADVVVRVERHALMLAQAAMGSWYRVTLPDGAVGYIRADLAEAATQPVSLRHLAAGEPLFESPNTNAAVVLAAPSDTVVGVFGRYGDYELVQLAGSRAGWAGTGASEGTSLGR
jgi:murein DD-endopeptidase MepM/ murein hydrolase activator NlpD